MSLHTQRRPTKELAGLRLLIRLYIPYSFLQTTDTNQMSFVPNQLHHFSWQYFITKSSTYEELLSMYVYVTQLLLLFSILAFAHLQHSYDRTVSTYVETFHM